MKQKRKGFSLNWGLLGIVVGCWLIPMLLTLAALSYYTARNMQKQFDDTVEASVTNSASTVRRTIRSAVTSSRAASYNTTIRDAYDRYLERGNRELLYKSVDFFLSQQYRYDDNFASAILFFTDEPSTLYYTLNITMDSSYQNITDYQSGAHDAVLGLAKDLDTKIAFYNSGGGIYMIRNLVDSDFKPYAVIVTQLNQDAVFGGFGSIAWETAATVYLNGVPFNANPSREGKPLAIPSGLKLSTGERVTVQNGSSIHVYGRESTDSVEILYAVEADMQVFLLGFINFAGIAYMLVFLLIPLLVLAVWFFYRNIFKPITALNSAAGAIQGGDLGYRIEDNVGNREFSYLVDAFNDMSVRLKQQFERIYSEELALRDARIMALQSQINPHFLNNTLEIINWEVRLGNNGKVSKMIEALATMLDAAMGRQSTPLVTLAQEMMYVDAYLYIISERFGKRLQVKKDIDATLLQYEVPRLIMQPIIENAVEHGVSRKQSGTIIIRAKNCGDFMRLEVDNNSPLSEKDAEIVAKLLSPDYDARVEGALHLGIHNVNLRLIMFYGEKSGLSITSDGNSTISAFSVPL